MNIVDIITALVALWAIIAGWRRGFISQLLTFAGVVLGVVLAVRFGAGVGSALGIDANVATVAGFAIVFVGTVIVTAIVSHVLGKLLSAIGLGSLNVLLGIVLAFAKCLLLLSIAYGAFDALNTETKMVEEKTLNESVTFRPICNISKSLIPLFDWAKAEGEKAAGAIGDRIGAEKNETI